VIDVENKRSKIIAQDMGALAIFVREMALHGNNETASRIAGIHVQTSYLWLRKQEVMDALHLERERLLQTKGAAAAIKALLEMVEDKATPSAARVQSAKTLLGLAGHSEGAAAADVAGRKGRQNMADMDADQLERMIAGAKATLEAHRKQVTTIDVVPDVAPDDSTPSSLL
jgi:hypothetical protein